MLKYAYPQQFLHEILIIFPLKQIP